MRSLKQFEILKAESVAFGREVMSARAFESQSVEFLKPTIFPVNYCRRPTPSPGADMSGIRSSAP
jgi:hypothetical protein